MPEINVTENVLVCAAGRYDRALSKSRRMYPPPQGISLPKPTESWPKENILLLQEYQQWLLDGGVSRNCIYQIYIPMAGHVLGLNRVPHRQISLDEDLDKALVYIEARQMSDGWTANCRRALNRFRSFMQLKRGTVTFSEVKMFDHSRYIENLPPWLVECLNEMRILAQANWRKSRVSKLLLKFWRSHTVLWDWLVVNGHLDPDKGPEGIKEIRRQQIYDYIDSRMDDGMNTATINLELRLFQSTLRYLQDQEVLVPASLLAIKGLKQKDRMPRFLKDEDVAKLRDYHEERVKTVTSPQKSRDVLLDRAMFYLMWQAGLRLDEVEDLLIDDVDLDKQQVTIRAGKGIVDRIVYLTPDTISSLKAYLTRRGQGVGKWQDHFFLYRFKGADRRMIGKRVKVAGKAVGVKVSPHRLRHTFATQLVNVGCPITTIQRLMGHKRLSSTMVYARVHDKTVADHYFKAMAAIEAKMTGQCPNNTLKQTYDNFEDQLKQIRAMAGMDMPQAVADVLANLENSLLDTLQRWPVT
ncbi:MAG: site-specific integrase [Chloroflexota bacterium]